MRLNKVLENILKPDIMIAFDIMRQLMRGSRRPMADGEIFIAGFQHGQVILFEVAVVEEEGFVSVEGHGAAGGVVEDLQR